jgi:valyl-tRNA synthetase
MDISKKYDPSLTEDKWYAYWQKNGFFHARVNPEKQAYTVVIPPPNVTGVLHMGHMLNNTIQDVLVRRARMLGYEACWVPGTDHASIATEAKVVGMLREKGIKKRDLTRDEFLKYAWEWKDKYGGIILEQLKKLGASCDWERTAFTMDEDYYRAVIQVFIDLHAKGYIYRDLRMINWDCEAQTALSNEEVIYNEDGEQATMYSIRYKVESADDEWLTIATVRPETIFGDTAIAVNPDDARYQHLIGKTVLVPFINRPIPVIADAYVDKDFGTGCLKVTPAHDPNDFEIGQRHQLEVIDTINNDGTLNEKCGMAAYMGKDRFAVRKLVVKDLEQTGQLAGTKSFVTRIGRSERTNTVVEPKLSLQWFIRMKAISQQALEAVENDEIALIPAKFKNTYRYWMENVRDWCISRQLWWGHRIPAYYYGTQADDYVIAASEEEALTMARKKSGNEALTASDLRQDEDVLDTWASSWLWPLQVFGGFDAGSFDAENGKIDMAANAELNYFYPTAVLVTAPEILFFWVARMIIAGYEYTGKKPFRDVYLTGIVRDAQRRKMSKSLGNSPEPLELIKRYSADGVRTGMLFSSPAGNDLLFDEKLCEQGRNFSNKIWNALRLVKGWKTEKDLQKPEEKTAIAWFESRMHAALAEIDDHFGKYRISDALITAYKLVWNDFCSWYLELVKPGFEQPVDENTYNSTLDFFERLMQMLHPFMPFITEEIWHALQERKEGESLMMSAWPTIGKADEALMGAAEVAFEVVAQVRNIRQSKNIGMKKTLPLLTTRHEASIAQFHEAISKLANTEPIQLTDNTPEDAFAFMAGTTEWLLLLDAETDDGQAQEAAEKEIEYLQGFLNSVDKKLSNERFMQNAPEQVVATEKKKKADAEQKLETLLAQLERMKAN